MLNVPADLGVEDLVRLLDLAPHPEGGFYRETYRDPTEAVPGRAASTAIYFLLPAGVVSAWHRIDAAELWHFYAGMPLRLSLVGPDGATRNHDLGTDLLAGERPQCVVPAGFWQMAEARAPERSKPPVQKTPPWSLVGCTVAPAFLFSTFELAPIGWQPN